MKNRQKKERDRKKAILAVLAVGVIAAFPCNPVRAAGSEMKEQRVVSNVGSISKVYVSTAVLQLCQQGLVDLDEPVTTYLPEFQMENERYRDITVRMLMNHTSGLMGSTWGDSMLLNDNDSVSRDTLLEKLSHQRLKADPGEFGVYCNDGFFVLELLVERVSGESYTDYISDHIKKPLGLSQTGTPYDMFQSPYAMDIYTESGDKYAYEYCMNVGSGGIIASAYDLCKFGTAFFEGDDTLLTEESKEEMYRSYAKDPYESPYGLGWDDVNSKISEDNPAKVLGKGGDTGNQHAYLMVAPEEKISIAVTVSGSGSGASSVACAAMAGGLMEEILDEGTAYRPNEIREVNIQEQVPKAYTKYTGAYATNFGSTYRIAFPDGKYMTATECDRELPQTIYFKYCGEGGFVRMSGDIEQNIQDHNQEIWYFRTRTNGEDYIVRETKTELPGLMTYPMKDYYAQKLKPCEVSQEAIQAWKSYEGIFRSYSGKYSNAFRTEVNYQLKVSEELPGYVMVGKEGEESVYRIVDETHAESFVQIPCQNGRDLLDLTIEQRDGKCLMYRENAGEVLLAENSMPEFTRDITHLVTTKDEAIWYHLNEETADSTVSFARTEKTAVFIFDKYGTLVYSNYMSEYPNEISLPVEGTICFVGETGEQIDISFSQS